MQIRLHNVELVASSFFFFSPVTLLLTLPFQIRASIHKYHEVEDITREGALHRLISPFQGKIAAWMYVSKNQNEAVVFAGLTSFVENNWLYPHIRLRGLDPEAWYIVQPIEGESTKKKGSTLINAGLLVNFNIDGDVAMWVLTKT